MSEDENPEYVIGFSQCCVDPWRDAMNLEIKREMAFQHNVSLDMRVADNDSERQIADIRELSRSGIDVLLISPNESKPLTAIIDSIHNTGMPVILLDRKTNSSKYLSYIGASNYAIGREAAKFMKSKLANGGNVIEIQMRLTISPAVDRSLGFQTELANQEKLNLVASLEDNKGWEKLREEFIAAYQQNPNLTAVFGHNDELIGNVSNWLNEFDPNNDVLLVGVDGLIGPSGGIQMILNEDIDATFLYPTGGEEAVATAIKILEGRQVPKNIQLQTFAIDQNNARMLKLQGDKLFNQQSDIERQNELLYTQSRALKSQKIFTTILSVFSVLLLSLVGLVFYQLRRNKKTNRQLEEKNEKISMQHQKLEQLSKISEEANREKVEFFTNISHEFKTPLTLILAPTDDLIENEKSLTNEARHQLQLIRKNAERMHRLVGQLMDFRRIDTCNIKLHLEQVELVSFIKDIMSVFVNIKEAKNIDFKFISQLKEFTVFADIEMLDKVFFNLVSNAFKFTSDDGFIHIQLAESEVDDQIVVKVSDNGRGMSKEHVSHAFERFYQGENYSAKGTGLGLSLSKKLIELHNGEISVVSEKGIGSTFTIRLPKHLSISEEKTIDHPRKVEYQSASYKGLLEHELITSDDQIPDDSKLFEKAILIIEDNKDLVSFLSRKLSSKYRILSALNGEDGIRLAEANIPNLIICDLMLPQMQGDEVVTFLKENVMTAHIPIIMLTAKDSDAQKQASFSQGVYDFIAKPFNHEVLISKIVAVFKNLQSFKKYYGKELIYDIAKKKMTENERRLLTKFDAYVQQNYNNSDLNVDLICREMAISKVQLYRKVKALTGNTINEYIQSVRIETAKDLLSHTELSLSDIAYKCGYNSSSYFSRNFKNAVGASPSEWKKSNLPI